MKVNLRNLSASPTSNNMQAECHSLTLPPPEADFSKSVCGFANPPQKNSDLIFNQEIGSYITQFLKGAELKNFLTTNHYLSSLSDSPNEEKIIQQFENDLTLTPLGRFFLKTFPSTLPQSEVNRLSLHPDFIQIKKYILSKNVLLTAIKITNLILKPPSSFFDNCYASRYLSHFGFIVGFGSIFACFSLSFPFALALGANFPLITIFFYIFIFGIASKADHSAVSANVDIARTSAGVVATAGAIIAGTGICASLCAVLLGVPFLSVTILSLNILSGVAFIFYFGGACALKRDWKRLEELKHDMNKSIDGFDIKYNDFVKNLSYKDILQFNRQIDIFRRVLALSKSVSAPIRENIDN